jgi:hypothetical protein
LTCTFCIARELFLISLGFGFVLIEHDEPLGVMMGVDGGDDELLTVTAGGEFVRGDTVDVSTVNAAIKLGGGGFLLQPIAFSEARRTVICFAHGTHRLGDLFIPAPQFECGGIYDALVHKLTPS